MAKIAPEFIKHITEQGLAGSELEHFLDICQQPLRRSIRVNTLLAEHQQWLEQWQAKGYSLEPVPWCQQGFWIDETVKSLPTGLGNEASHQQGHYYIQEASSMLPVSALFDACPNPDLVLDMAAAPGSKTTQAAALMNNQGLIVANELSSSRLKWLYSNVQRCGLKNVALSHADGRVFGDKLAGTFDAILLDAPCGGEGTVRKDSQALENWSLDAVKSMAQLQKELIISAFKALKPGGTLVYSTCTLSEEENQQVCQHLLDSFSESISIYSLKDLFEGAEKALTKQGYLHIYPHIFDSEGFFVACFQKQKGLNKPSEEKSHRGKFPFHFIKPKELLAFSSYCQQFGWKLDEIKANLWQRDNEIWFFPTEIEALIGKIKLSRIGVKLAESHKKGYRLDHQAAIAFGSKFTTNCYQLNQQELIEYYQGKDIYPEKITDCLAGEVVVCYQNQAIGLGKRINQRIKNSLPRELVRDFTFVDYI